MNPKPWYWPVFSTIYKLIIGFFLGAMVASFVRAFSEFDTRAFELFVTAQIAFGLGIWFKKKVDAL